MSAPADARRGAGARLSDPRLWLSLVSAAIVVWLAVRAVQEEPGPGAISRVHARVSALEGGAACAACHGADGSVEAMRDACVACHERVGADLAAGAGFHGQLERGEDCARCHKEHLGESAAPYEESSFVLAGFDSLESYDHRGLAFGLEGAHDALECAACHANARATELEPGELRFGGMSQTCTACHEDAHAGRFGAACAVCHGQSRPFAEAAEFAHTERFPLAGAHSGLACVTCHEPGGDRAIESYGASDPPVRTCAECHASPHGVAFVEAAGSSCAACHAAERPSFRAADVHATRAAHGATGFALADAHAEVPCEACHDPALEFGERFPGRAPGACAVCHADPHGGQFAAAPGGASDCAECHTTRAFAPSEFDAEAHAGLAFPLEGAHADLACAACHQPREGGAPATFRGTPVACAACHEDVHRGAFDAIAAEDTSRGAEGDGCARCHDTRSFRGAAEGFRHGEWTRFALDGVHAALECSACHPPDPSGIRALGPASLAYLPGGSAGELASCTACHADPHAGRFDSADLPSVVEGRAGCARCHTTAGFSEIPPDRFDHGRWTGFRLEGAHAQTRCAACHGESNAEDALERRLAGATRLGDAGRGRPIEGCATCHADPHAGAFAHGVPDEVAGRVGCARCHVETSFRLEVDFDHAWTGFELAGRHAELDCAACHAPKVLDADGRSSARARGASCSDCHADPHGGQFARDGANDCSRCHDMERAFANVAFDHGATRFPLDASHSALPCSACHRPATTREGTTVVRYRPLGTSCVDCHVGAPPPRGGGEGR